MNISNINKLNQDEIDKLNKTIDELVISNKEKLNVIEDNKVKIQEFNNINKKKTEEIGILKENIVKLEQTQKKLASPEDVDKLRLMLSNKEQEVSNSQNKIEEYLLIIGEKEKKLNVS